MVLPLDLGVRIEENAPVRMLSQICDGLDYRQLEKAYTRKGYELAASPRRMFKIAAFGYMNGNYSSRGIEEACRRDIHYMWLLEGHKAPDHNTIARFRRDRLVPVMEDLFTQLVKALYERGEIAFGDLFVDGTKIEANANRYSFVWRKAVEKQAEKLAPKLTEQARQLQAEYGLLGETPEGTLFALEEKAKAEGIRFVSGKGSRKTRLQKDIESLGGLLEKERKYTEYGAVFEGRNSFSKTDTDATFMHMKEDHMQNGQLKPGYNLVLGVEGEYITGALLSSDRSDVNTLIPLLERMNTNYGRRNKSVTADAGFESEENCAYLEENGQMCFIKPANYEQRRKRLKNAYLRENMPYDPEQDAYTCPEGHRLLREGVRKRKYPSGYETELLVYKCESCEGCPQKALCTKAKGHRRMEFSPKFAAFRERALRNIQSPRGILLRMNRSIQVEGVFGVLKEDCGFRRFLLRGKSNVITEALLMAFAYNVNKLHAKTIQNRLGIMLHERLTG